MDEYVKILVDAWEDNHRKSQLNLWILLSLKAGHKHMAEIKQFIENYSSRTISADDKSMYRALRRYHDAELIEYEKVPGNGGPELKVYRLTDIGTEVLNHFIDRNILQIFYNDKVQELIMKGRK